MPLLTNPLAPFILITTLALIVFIFALILLKRQQTTQTKLGHLQHLLTEHTNIFTPWAARLDERSNAQQQVADTVFRLLNEQQKTQQQQRSHFDAHQIQSLKTLQDRLQTLPRTHGQVSATYQASP